MAIGELECRRCGHKWFPRTNRLPKACPKCKHYNWNTAWEVEHEVRRRRSVSARDISARKITKKEKVK